MKKIPVAKISNKEKSIIVYYPDYSDDIESDNPPKDLPPYPLPEYLAIGDNDLVKEFDFDIKNKSESASGYFPYPWSLASVFSYQFSQENGYDYKDILPKELMEESEQQYDSNITY